MPNIYYRIRLILNSIANARDAFTLYSCNAKLNGSAYSDGSIVAILCPISATMVSDLFKHHFETIEGSLQSC